MISGQRWRISFIRAMVPRTSAMRVVGFCLGEDDAIGPEDIAELH